MLNRNLSILKIKVHIIAAIFAAICIQFYVIIHKIIYFENDVLNTMKKYLWTKFNQKHI